MQAHRAIERLGRKHSALLGLTLNLVTSLLLALATYMESMTLFLLLSFVGYSLVQVSHFAILSAVFPNKVSLLLSLFEFAKGLGYSIGPLIGAQILAISNYTTVYFAFVGLALLGMLLIFMFYNKETTNVSTVALMRNTLTISPDA